MSKKDKIRIAELEAKCYVYEMGLGAAGMKPLEIPPAVKPEMGFVLGERLGDNVC